MPHRYETEYEIGQDNLKKFGMDIHNPVFWVSAILILALRGAVPVWGLALPAILAPAAMLAARGIDTAPGKQRKLKRAIEITLAIHAIGGLWLAAAVWSG